MISHKSIAGAFRLTTLGLGLAVAFSPSAMAGGHHQKGQLIAVPATSVASQPAQMSYVQPVQMSYVQPVQMSYVQPAQMSYVQPAQMSYVQAVAAPAVQMGYAAHLPSDGLRQPQAAPPQQAVPTVHITVFEAPAPPTQPQAAPPTPQATPQAQPQASYPQPQAAYASTQAVVCPPHAPGGLCPAAGGLSGGQRREFAGRDPRAALSGPQTARPLQPFPEAESLDRALIVRTIRVWPTARGLHLSLGASPSVVDGGRVAWPDRCLQ